MSSPQLSEPEVRSIVHLLVEVFGAGGGAAEKKRLLMDGLAKLVRADCWLWAWSPEFSLEKAPVYTSVAHGGFDDSKFPRSLVDCGHGNWERMARLLPKEQNGDRAHLTRTCRQPGTETCSPEISRILEDAGMGEVMVSMRPLESGGLSTIALYRGKGRTDFSAREIRIAHILLTEIGWMHEAAWHGGPLPETANLSPRRRAVLGLVLEGRARKDMAQELGISVHTLDGYVKDIFRHFKAHSQVELIARFRSGNGRDTP